MHVHFKKNVMESLINTVLHVHTLVYSLVNHMGWCAIND